MKSRLLTFENRLFWAVLAAALPPVFGLAITLWLLEISLALWLLILLPLVMSMLFIAWNIKYKFSFQLRTLANLLEAITRNDFTLRGRKQGQVQNQPGNVTEDAMNDMVGQINQLADSLQIQRLQAKESQILVDKVINHVDIAIFAIDSKHNVTMANQVFADYYDAEISKLTGRNIESLQLTAIVEGSKSKAVDWHFPNISGRFSVYSDVFIEQGQQQRLFLLKDISHLLREEERQAWQKLIRVISHEINNSLTPISSLSGSLQKVLTQPDKQQAVANGLAVIEQRAASLVKFVSSYKKLAKLPEPIQQKVELVALIQRAITLQHQIKIEFNRDVEQLELSVDEAQLQQVLINLLKNAAESNAIVFQNQQPPAVELSLAVFEEQVIIKVKDEGTGISNPDNLFVPFYSTKPQGSGIGLVVSRQIIEAHNGSLSLENNSASGCSAIIKLPR